MSNFVGFKLSKEHDDALVKLAGLRQSQTGERVDKSMLLREAVDNYLAAYNAQDIAQTVADFAADKITQDETVDQLALIQRRACQEQRAHSEREWSGRNDEQ